MTTCAGGRFDACFSPWPWACARRSPSSTSTRATTSHQAPVEPIRAESRHQQLETMLTNEYPKDMTLTILTILIILTACSTTSSPDIQPTHDSPPIPAPASAALQETVAELLDVDPPCLCHAFTFEEAHAWDEETIHSIDATKLTGPTTNRPTFSHRPVETPAEYPGRSLD